MFLYNIMVLSFSHSGTHAYFDRTHARDILPWFRPQFDDKIISSMGIMEYTRYRILLETQCTGIILQRSHVVNTNAFLLKCDGRTTYVIGCLWSRDTSRHLAFRMLMDYYTDWVPDTVLCIKDLDDDLCQAWNEVLEDM
jgi:hypothetical protein